MNKKTLIIIYWDLGIGGIQKRIRDLATGIIKEKKNWSITILLRKSAHESFQEQFEHIERVTIQTYPFDSRRVRPLGGFFFSTISSKTASLRIARSIRLIFVTSHFGADFSIQESISDNLLKIS